MKNKTEKIIKRMYKTDEILSKYASKNRDSIRLVEEENDIRPNYFRDIDRIIHSLSYTHYIDKTQVFSKQKDDYISKRMVHVQLVSKIARTIGRGLNLNEDLIEAIALGHDIGHVPYGHVGEAILNKISLEYNEGMFNHNVQSVRTLMEIEAGGKGKNLSLQVIDGILCHNGEFISDKYAPKFKNTNIFKEEYKKCYYDIDTLKHLTPMTLEGCVVRISDIIGYIGRDIEDAIKLGILKKESIPKNIKDVLGDNNRDIINTVILDILDNSIDKPYIKMSEEVYEAIKSLKDFNYKNIYYKANTKEDLKNYEIMFRTLFKKYVKDIESKNDRSSIYKTYLNYMTDEYNNNTTTYRKVIDYIAGMTDLYFNHEYNKIKRTR